MVVLGGEDPPPDIPDVARALRHFDLSVVINLSRQPYEEKANYLKVLLPMVASLRRTTGLPHRIIVDEAHYFLREPMSSSCWILSWAHTRSPPIARPTCTPIFAEA